MSKRKREREREREREEVPLALGLLKVQGSLSLVDDPQLSQLLEWPNGPLYLRRGCSALDHLLNQENRDLYGLLISFVTNVDPSVN